MWMTYLGLVFGTALVHTLIPDHWLPFVLVGRAQGWPDRKTLGVTAVAGLLEILVTLVLFAVTLAVGEGAAQKIGERFHLFSAMGLLFFGLVYAFFAWRRGEHTHFHFHLHAHAHRDPGGPPAAGESLHRQMTVWALVLAVGLSPCVVVFPLFWPAVSLGWVGRLAVMLAFSAGTLGGFMGVTYLSLKRFRGLRMKLLDRYGELMSGLLIALLGFVFLLLE
jgi:hypothetical protein